MSCAVPRHFEVVIFYGEPFLANQHQPIIVNLMEKTSMSNIDLCDVDGFSVPPRMDFARRPSNSRDVVTRSQFRHISRYVFAFGDLHFLCEFVLSHFVRSDHRIDVMLCHSQYLSGLVTLSS